VRVIFTLPRQFGDYPHPLAYVEWYTAFGTRDPDSGLYTIKPSTAARVPRASIVRVDRFLRPCHLVGKFGGKHIPTTWTTDNVLDETAAFYLNSYSSVDFWSYFCLPPMSRVST
jgi:hypothetical protein